MIPGLRPFSTGSTARGRMIEEALPEAYQRREGCLNGHSLQKRSFFYALIIMLDSLISFW